jgi:predicted nucleotidyltransferase
MRAFEEVLAALTQATAAHYGDRLVSLAVFGSVGRGTPRPDSDIDLLVVADPLPDGRLARVADFDHVEEAIPDTFASGRRAGLHTRLSPVMRTPAEIRQGSPLLLDMTEDAKLLIDRGGFLAAALADLRSRLAARGARRVWRGSAWCWDLKPDYRPGDVFEL